MIEYAVRNVKKMSADDLEEELNDFAKKGWKVLASVNNLLILRRSIKVQED